MHSVITSHLDELRSLCIKHRVKSLSLFGSAATGEFRPGESDLDFLVEFEPLTLPERAAHFFALEAELQELLGVAIDLGEPDGIRNRRIRDAIEKSKVSVYAAA